MKDDNQKDQFEILRKINNNPSATQRELAKDLMLSLGKINYCLKALKSKGLVKIKNFSNNKNKFHYAYILTPKGIKIKTELTINRHENRMREIWISKMSFKFDILLHKWHP